MDKIINTSKYRCVNKTHLYFLRLERIKQR
nr:MAG TPA: hypothetical protein [Caudoviricetes sp.]